MSHSGRFSIDLIASSSSFLRSLLKSGSSSISAKSSPRTFLRFLLVLAALSSIARLSIALRSVRYSFLRAFVGIVPTIAISRPGRR